MPVSPFNKNYFEVSGTFNGAEPTSFEIKVTGASGSEGWYYRTKTLEGEYTAYNTSITLVVGTQLQLGSTGVYIKFTRTSATSYTAGDIWRFSTQSDVKLDESIGQFDHIETIDVGDERNLLAISSTSGRVATIANIDGDKPVAEPSELNIGSGTSGHLLDFEQRNKELYIAKGRDSHPQFLGYSKNNGFEGVGESELRSNPAFDVLEGASNPNTDAYDCSVILRGGGGANLKDAKIAVGINNVTDSGAIKDSVTIQNLPDNRLYEYGCITTPISIKRYYGVSHGAYCDGFAVLRKPELNSAEYAGTIDLWNLNSALGGTIGQQANMFKSIQLKKPEFAENINTFGDFYLVPETSAMDKFTVVCARNRGTTQNFNGADNNSWLFKSGTLNKSAMHANTTTIGDWDDITPAVSADEAATAYNLVGNEMYFLQRVIHNGPQSVTAFGSTHTATMPDFIALHSTHYSSVNMKPKIVESAEYSCLSFAGFNAVTSGVGTSPMLSYTAKVGPKLDSYGHRNWWSARNALITTGKKQINMGVAFQHSDEDGKDQAGWFTECFGPFMADNNSNDDAKVFRPVSWCTWMVQISASNSGSGKYKVFPHMLDWAEQGTQAKKYKTFWGSQSFTIPNWVTSIENNAGEGGRTGSSPNTGVVKLNSVPSKAPNFGYKGSIKFSTRGTTRQRHLLHYIRPGNRKALTFRFGTETNTPQSLSGHSTPQLFPNDWILEDANITVDNVASSAYSLWNLDANDSIMNVNFFGTAAKANNARRARSIPSLGTGGDDKMGYRIAEHGNIVQNVDASGTQWFPGNNEHLHIFGVRYRANESKARYTLRMNGGLASTNLYTSSVSEFAVTQPVESSVANSWAGVVAKKVFYKASLIYDGFQETPLLSTQGSLFVSGGLTKAIRVDIRIADTYPISERITGVALYRASSATGDVVEPETLFRFIEEIPLFQFNHNAVGGYQSVIVEDTGDAEGTYESINGLSEKIFDLSINYTVNTQQNGYHFVANCHHTQIADAENYLFRSQAGKFAIFDWTKDFVELPFIPSSLIGFQGKVYCFSTNQTAIINPETMFIEDVIEGIGCINSKTSLITDAGLVWCDYRNIYLASPSITPIGTTILNVKDDGWLNLSLKEKEDIRCGYDSKRKAFLFFYTRGTTYRCWAYSAQKGRWDLFETPERVMDTTLTKDGATILLLESNKLAKFLAHTSISKDWYWESKRLSLGNTMVDKKVRNFKLEANSRNLTSMQYKLDGDSDWTTGQDVATNFTGSQNKAFKLSVADSTKKVHWIKIKIAGDNSVSGTDVKAFATSVIYKPKRPK